MRIYWFEKIGLWMSHLLSIILESKIGLNKMENIGKSISKSGNAISKTSNWGKKLIQMAFFSIERGKL